MVYAPDLTVIAGGFMFGIGAAVNGGCSFGTLIRFGAGELSFIASFIGMAIGVWLHRHLLMSADPFPKGLSVVAHPSWPGLLLLGIIALFCLRELLLLPGWKGAGSRSPEQAAMAIGLAGGPLYIFNGPWPYTVAFDQLVNRSRPNQLHGLVLASPLPLWPERRSVQCETICFAFIANGCCCHCVFSGCHDGLRRGTDPGR
jgi:hypothetical protein